MAGTSSYTPVFGNSHGYWLRCGVAIQECSKGACLDILLHPGVCGLPDDEQKLYALLIVFKQNESKRLKKVITYYQWDILCHVCDKHCPVPCPKNGRTPINELDITLICILIRNIDKIVTGFDISLLTPFLPFIEDAREIRNFMMHSSDPTSLGTYQKFHDIWLKIEKNLNGLNYRDMNRFHSLKTSPLDSYTTQKLDWLNSCYQDLSLAKCDKTEMKKLEAMVIETNQELTTDMTRLEASVIETNQELTTDMTRLEASVIETNQELTTDMTRLEASVIETKTYMTRLEAKVEGVQQKEFKATSAELKDKTQKQYSRMKVAFNPNVSSPANNDVIDREEIIVDLSIVSRTSSVFDTTCDKQQIERLREQQKQNASDTVSTINYSEIVTSKDDYVIISGIPGSGKTTLVETVLHKWSMGEMWCESDYAFVIYLRKLVRFKDQSDITAKKMISYFYPGYDIEELARSGKAILILEGFDELYGKSELRSKEEEYSCYTRSIHDLFDPQNPSLPFTRLVTSRPGSCPILLETVLSDNTHLKMFIVTGFSNDSIHRYVENHFQDANKADVVISKLKNVPVVYDSMMVPFNCWGVCYLIKNDIPMEEFGQTETSLYANLLTLFIRNHGFRNSKIKLKDVHTHTKFKEICVGLAALAYQLELNNKINFIEEDLPVDVSIQTLIQDSGMIIKIDGEVDTFYQFLHYTFHEFFVALHMMSSGKYYLPYHTIYDNVDQIKAMLAGLLGGSTVESQSNTTLKRISKLFDTPKSESVNIEKMILGVYKTHELLQLVYEFHNPITLDGFISKLYADDHSTGTHVEYFKKLCADKNVHFRINELVSFFDTDCTKISSLLTCSECKSLKLYNMNKAWYMIVEENHFEKITLSCIETDMSITESLLSLCLQRCRELIIDIINLDYFQKVINMLTVLQQSSLNTTVTRLVLDIQYYFVTVNPDYNIANILDACDICEHLVIRFVFLEDAEKYKDEGDRVFSKKIFKVLKEFSTE